MFIFFGTPYYFDWNIFTGFVLQGLAILFLSIWSVMDIKTRVVTHRNTNIGIMVAFVFSLFLGTILNSVIAFFWGYLIGILLYWGKVWGGADVKALMFAGAVVGKDDFLLFLWTILLLYSPYVYTVKFCKVKDIPLLPLFLISMVVTFIYLGI